MNVMNEGKKLYQLLFLYFPHKKKDGASRNHEVAEIHNRGKDAKIIDRYTNEHAVDIVRERSANNECQSINGGQREMLFGKEEKKENKQNKGCDEKEEPVRKWNRKGNTRIAKVFPAKPWPNHIESDGWM